MMDVSHGVVVGASQARIIQELLADGATNLEIARRLYLGEQTVKSHIKTLMRKTGAKNRTHLALLVERKNVEVFVNARPNY